MWFVAPSRRLAAELQSHGFPPPTPCWPGHRASPEVYFARIANDLSVSRSIRARAADELALIQGAGGDRRRRRLSLALQRMAPRWLPIIEPARV